MKFSPKCRVLCLELKQDRRRLKKGRGAAGKGKRGGPSLHIGLAGALWQLACIEKAKASTITAHPGSLVSLIWITSVGARFSSMFMFPENNLFFFFFWIKIWICLLFFCQNICYRYLKAVQGSSNEYPQWYRYIRGLFMEEYLVIILG